MISKGSNYFGKSQNSETALNSIFIPADFFVKVATVIRIFLCESCSVLKIFQRPPKSICINTFEGFNTLQQQRLYCDKQHLMLYPPPSVSAISLLFVFLSSTLLEIFDQSDEET